MTGFRRDAFKQWACVTSGPITPEKGPHALSRGLQRGRSLLETRELDVAVMARDGQKG